MSSLTQQIDNFAGRVTNRLLARFPGPMLDVRTDTPVVSFTFDDVPDTAMSEGARILEAHGGRGTFYIASGMLARREEQRTLIDAAGCAELLARGHEIGCHTHSHINLRQVSRGALRADLDQNGAVLAKVAPGFVPRNFAFPYNAGSFRQRGELTRRYRSSRGGLPGINRGPTDRSFLRSFALQQPESSVAQLHSLIDDLVANPGWLIFFGHDLSAAPTPYGCTPTSFEALVRHARNSGCAILTVNQALDRYGAVP
jgi:peptidoglycan/xylan/chitin deacetylase (PgdA/CDA1 family)